MSSVTTEEALAYHCSGGVCGKISIAPTKPLATQRDLSLAYTPGVAAPVLEIERDPDLAYRYTAKGNLVAVVSNGTAVLGLGDRGPLASKPVMEGKGVLFKRFADVDVFDIEVTPTDPDELVKVVAAIAPTFGGINLEDIKAPECFAVEEQLSAMLDVPVFHDDQHGTAIIVAAGLLNACRLVEKDLASLRVVVNGAGAAGISCAKLMLKLGVRREGLTLCDSAGVVYRGRSRGMNRHKEALAADTSARTLADALRGADVFIGCSVADALTADMCRSMAARPVIFALANPDPEIHYGVAKAARPDAIVATGRSDFPNQVNNVLCFPFLFRGALDVHALRINDAMKLAAAHAIADLARRPVPRCVQRAYGVEDLAFGPDYIIPKPFDPRVLLWEAPAVAEAAMASGVTRVRIDDLEAYRESLVHRVSLRHKAFDSCEDCRTCGLTALEEVAARPVAVPAIP